MATKLPLDFTRKLEGASELRDRESVSNVHVDVEQEGMNSGTAGDI